VREDKLKITIPSVLGSEKAAMEKAAEVAREMGFSEDRVQDLKTAVAEACVNAIEHGNRFNESTDVGVTMTTNESSLTVSVRDKGTGPGETSKPDLDKKMAGKDKTRGWGMFLIENLMDEVQFLSDTEGGNIVRMVIHLEK
jgi:serine/threonine-protein kinase RsbW